MQDVSLLSIATAVPPHVIEQDEVTRLAPKVFPDLFARYPVMIEIFKNSGVDRRRAVRPMEWYLAARDWSDRAALFLEAGVALFEETARLAIDRAGVAPADIDLVMTVCSTGIATPSLEARALKNLGLRANVRRVPVFGLGCAGGVGGLSIGATLATAAPGTNVLVVVIELCSLAFRLDRGTKEDAVASALFGDGAAALVLRADKKPNGALARVTGSAEHIWPDTLNVMGWTVDPVGFGVMLSRSIPTFVERRFPKVMGKLLDAVGLKRADVARFVCHPGGGRVVDALETALDLPRGALDHERAVLREFGNMSAPTVLFALERVLRDKPKDTVALSALGPGFTASLVALQPGHA